MGRDADLVQDLGNGKLVTVHAGIQHPLFLPLRRLEHPGGKDAFVKGLYKIVGKAFVQQLLLHFLTLECPGDKKRSVAFPGGVVALFYRQCVQSGHKSVQQNHLRADRKHLLQHLVAVLFYHSHLYAFLFQCIPAGCSDRCIGIRHQKSDLVHGCSLQCVLFP